MQHHPFDNLLYLNTTNPVSVILLQVLRLQAYHLPRRQRQFAVHRRVRVAGRRIGHGITVTFRIVQHLLGSFLSIVYRLVLLVVVVVVVGGAVLVPGAGQEPSLAVRVAQRSHQVVDERFLEFCKLRVIAIHVRRYRHAQASLLVALHRKNTVHYNLCLQLLLGASFKVGLVHIRFY